MTEPRKGHVPDLKDSEGFGATYQRARETLSTLPNVAGVAFGAKLTGGAFTNEVAILVYVREKRPLGELPAEHRVPPTFEGYLTDVRVHPPIVPGICHDPSLSDVIKGGIQISPKARLVAGIPGFFPGTLGCIVRRRNDPSRENCYLLSNKHVLYDIHTGANDNVYHPIPPEIAATAPSTKLKTLGPVMPGGVFANVPALNPPVGSAPDVFIDCAIARVVIDSDSCCCRSTRLHTADTIKGLNANGTDAVLTDVRNVMFDGTFVHKTVFKVGRTTGRTRGKVSAIDAPYPIDIVDPTDPLATAFRPRNNIEIVFEPTPTQPKNDCLHTWFAETGDSGSVVVDEQNRVVGIISHVPDPANPLTPADAASYACHIVPILDQLDICIPCSPGGSHGTTTATDGSGLQPSPKNPPHIHDEVMADGDILFAGGHTAAATNRGALPSPLTFTDDETQTMRAWLAAFTATPIGGELYDVFDQLRHEVGYLIRNSRPVTVAWHRGKGPAYLTHVLNHLAGHTERVPHEVQGVTRGDLLSRMRTTLEARGSNQLREALQRHGDMLFALATDPACHTIADWLLLVQDVVRDQERERV